MNGTQTTLWAIALGLGAVVIAVTVLLLHRFTAQVHRIADGVNAVWSAGTSVARNTAATWMMEETVDRLDAIIDEAEQHDRALSDRSER